MGDVTDAAALARLAALIWPNIAQTATPAPKPLPRPPFDPAWLTGRDEVK